MLDVYIKSSLWSVLYIPRYSNIKGNLSLISISGYLTKLTTPTNCKTASFRSHKPQNTPRSNIEALKNEHLRVQFYDKLEFQLIFLNLYQRNIEESNNVIVSFLTKAGETVLRWENFPLKWTFCV